MPHFAYPPPFCLYRSCFIGRKENLIACYADEKRIHQIPHFVPASWQIAAGTTLFNHASMLLLLRIILGISFFGIVFVVVKQKIRHTELCQAIVRDIKNLPHRLIRLGQRKVSHARHAVSSLASWSIFFSWLIKHLRAIFFWLGSKLRVCILFILPHVKRLPRRFRKGVLLFSQDVTRVALATQRFLFKKGSGFIKTVRQDLRTFELPKHKEDFFDRLQEERQESEKKHTKAHVRVHERTLGSSSGSKASKSKLSLRTSALTPSHTAVAPPSLSDQKKTLPGFQSEEVPSEHPFQVPFDLALFHQKEEQLLLQITKNPKNPSSYKRLGKVYLQLDNWQDARQCFEHAIKLGARDPELQQLLAQTHKGG